MHNIDLKQYKVNLKTSKNIKKGHLYIVGAYLNRPLQFAVCLGFTDRNEPYFYLFGALQGYFTKNGNSIVAVLDTDYMKDMLVPIVHYEFSKTANQKSFLHSVNIHIYDINIGKIPIDIDLWYLKQKMIIPELPTLKSEQKELKPVGKKDLKVGEVYLTRQNYGNGINVYLGYLDNEFNYYSLNSYKVSRIVQHKAPFSHFGIKSTKTKPKFYAFNDMKDILSPADLKACIELRKLISEDMNVLHR